MLRNNKKLKFFGFTMPEMLLGLVIAGIAVATTIAIYVMVSQMWKDDLVMNELSRNANIGIERMLHGVTVNTGLLAAKEISLPLDKATADGVTYMDSTGASRRFYYSAGKILDQTSGSTIIPNVYSAAFYHDGQMVRINLDLRKASGRKEIKLLAETRVKKRNKI